MKKLHLLIIALIILLANTVQAQDFWEQLYFPDSVSIRCMTTNAQGHIFVGVGNSNEPNGVYRSTDNAQTWEFIYNNNGFDVLSMDIDENGYIYMLERMDTTG